MLKSEVSNKEFHLQSRYRNFIALWQCRFHAFNNPCKNSLKKPQQGLPSLLLLAVAFKLRILPLVRACVMLQLASPCPAGHESCWLRPRALSKNLYSWLDFLASSSLWTCAMIQTLGWTWVPSTNYSDNFAFFLWNRVLAGEVTHSEVWLPAPWPMQSSLPLVLSDSLHLLSRKWKLQ